MLLNRIEAPVVHMQYPTEGALDRLTKLVQERINKDKEPKILKRKITGPPSLSLDKVSFIVSLKL